MSKLLIRSIASNIYYFSVCAEKVFSNKMMPIVGLLINLAKSLQKHIEPNSPSYKFEDTEEKKEINAIIGEIENIMKKDQPIEGKDLLNFIKDKKLTAKLASKIE